MGTRALAALALVGVLVVGCSDDPEPKIADPTPTPSSSVASPSPTVTEAVDPEQAYRDFIDTYVAAISESLSTGDASAWLAMSDPACKNCQNLASGLEIAYANGGRIEGGNWAVDSATPGAASDVGDIWAVGIKSARERWRAADGSLVKTVPPGINSFTFAIATTSDGLTLRELEFAE